MQQGYDPQNFLLFDDSALLTLYSQAAAIAGLGLPLYMLLLQEALGGLEATLIYGLRTTAAASGFLLLVHFCAANMVVRIPRLPREKWPAAPLHSQHALSLLFTTQQMHLAQGLALARLFPGRLAAQPPALTWLMAASYVALWLLARSWGAVRCSWTTEAAAHAAVVRPPGAGGLVPKACRFFLAAVYTVTYAYHAVLYAQQGHLLSHSAAGAVAFAGAWVHAALCWRKRRQLAAEDGGSGDIVSKND